MIEAQKGDKTMEQKSDPVRDKMVELYAKRNAETKFYALGRLGSVLQSGKSKDWIDTQLLAEICQQCIEIESRLSSIDLSIWVLTYDFNYWRRELPTNQV
jgi:hypothetical protein